MDRRARFPVSRLKVAVFDMDSTLIEQEVIDELAVEAGVADEVKAATAAAMAGNVGFDESLRRRVALLKGLSTNTFPVVLERLTLTPGAAELIAWLKGHGVATAIVSGGFVDFCEPLRARLGVDHVFANIFEKDGQGRLTGRLAGDVVTVNAEGKRQALLSLCRERGCGADQSLAVGDGANDIPMLTAAGVGVAFNAKPKVEAAAPLALRGESLMLVRDLFS